MIERLRVRIPAGALGEFSSPEIENLSGNELTRNSSGNTRPQSSHLAEPLWTDSDLKCGISERDLIFTFFFFLKHRLGMNYRTFSQNPRTRGKSHHVVMQWAVFVYDAKATGKTSPTLLRFQVAKGSFMRTARNTPV